MLFPATDGRARRIAADWHSGQASALYSFTSTGMIDDLVQVEVAREIKHLEVQQAARILSPDMVAELDDLRFLAAYLEEQGHRTPVEGWSRIWG